MKVALNIEKDQSQFMPGRWNKKIAKQFFDNIVKIDRKMVSKDTFLGTVENMDINLLKKLSYKYDKTIELYLGDHTKKYFQYQLIKIENGKVIERKTTYPIYFKNGLNFNVDIFYYLNNDKYPYKEEILCTDTSVSGYDENDDDDALIYGTGYANYIYHQMKD